MGNSNEVLTRQLTHVQDLQDPHFGEVQIYRDDEGTFLMKSKCTHIVGDKRTTDFQRIVHWVKATSHKSIVPILKLLVESRTLPLYP